MCVKNNKLYGVSSEIVVDMVIKRKINNYASNSKSDGFKLGLVIEGGGMRGVICTAALSALHDLGLTNCFDAIYGTSAGAIGAGYFLSGNPDVGTAIFYENLTNNKFINLFRVNNILDINYLFDNYVTTSRPIDFKKVLSSSIDFFVSTTNIKTGKVNWIDKKKCNKTKIIKALRASSSTPLFTSNLEKIEGDYYNDGMINAGIPVQKAIEDKCTHIVSLLTREHGYKKKDNFFVKLLESFILSIRGFTMEYKKAYYKRIIAYNSDLYCLYDNNLFKSLVIAPEKNNFMISNSEKDPEKLLRAANESRQRVFNIFKNSSSGKSI